MPAVLGPRADDDGRGLPAASGFNGDSLARGDFQKAPGPNVAIRTIVFSAGPSVIEARFAGQIDLATIGPSPALNGCVQSKGAARPIVAGAASAGTAFVVRPAAESAGGGAGRSSNFLAELKRNPLT